MTRLNNAFTHKQDGSGVFEEGQNPIVVGQAAYNSAYGTSFTGGDGLVQIFDTSLTFNTLLGDSLSMNLKPKMIQDEMGEAFELEYGRMSGFLGVETPNAQAGLQNMILHPYVFPPTEVLDGLELPSVLRRVLMLNPLAPLVTVFRDCAFTGRVSNPGTWAAAFGFSLIAWWAGTRLFDRYRDTLVEAV